jgi:hypothetical protein
MRKLFPVVLSGMIAVSFSQIAAAQSVGAQEQSSSAGATSGERTNPDSKDKDKDKEKQRSGSSSSGAAADKGPSPGKGYAKGWEQGKGNPHGASNQQEQDKKN